MVSDEDVTFVQYQILFNAFDNLYKDDILPTAYDLLIFFARKIVLD